VIRWSGLTWTGLARDLEGSATRRSVGWVAQRARSGQCWARDCAPGATGVQSAPGARVALRAPRAQVRNARQVSQVRRARHARRARRGRANTPPSFLLVLLHSTPPPHRMHRPQRVPLTTVEGQMFAPLWLDGESNCHRCPTPGNEKGPCTKSLPNEEGFTLTAYVALPNTKGPLAAHCFR